MSKTQILPKGYPPGQIKMNGCRGRRIKILPEKSDILGQEDLVQRGKVVGVGPDATCRINDIIIFSTDGLDKVDINGEKFYYVLDTDIFVYEVLQLKLLC